MKANVISASGQNDAEMTQAITFKVLSHYPSAMGFTGAMTACAEAFNNMVIGGNRAHFLEAAGICYDKIGPAATKKAKPRKLKLAAAAAKKKPVVKTKLRKKAGAK